MAAKCAVAIYSPTGTPLAYEFKTLFAAGAREGYFAVTVVGQGSSDLVHVGWRRRNELEMQS